MLELTQQTCQDYPKGSPALTETETQSLINQCEGWQANDTNTEIIRDYRFKNYYETISFVNAIAWICHTENHHPDLTVTYNHCIVRFSTHSVSGLSTNDFICAAKANALIKSQS
jgi:4a-hydroxytetrahydrobiopterin dehydratase